MKLLLIAVLSLVTIIAANGYVTDYITESYKTENYAESVATDFPPANSTTYYPANTIGNYSANTTTYFPPTNSTTYYPANTTGNYSTNTTTYFPPANSTTSYRIDTTANYTTNTTTYFPPTNSTTYYAKNVEWQTRMSMSNFSASNGWQNGKSLSECNSYMLGNQLYTDVYFKVGLQSGTPSLFGAHKYVLVSRSAFFEEMFYGSNSIQTPDKQETGGSINDPIVIQDMDPVVFMNMLNYMYTDNVTMTPKTVLPLMYAGRKYQLPKLIGECQKLLQQNLSADTACEILDQAIYFEEQELINKTIEYIGKQAVTVAKTAGFLQMSREGLFKVVSYEKLQISEAILYRSCLNWAITQLKKRNINNPTDYAVREQLGEVLNKIRFPVMSLQEFAEVSGNSDILTCSEKASIYYYIGTKDQNQTTLSFDWKPRRTEKIIDRFTFTTNGSWCGSQNDAIQFKSDKNMMLTAIDTYPMSTSTANNYYYSSYLTIMSSFNLAIDVTENTQTSIYYYNSYQTGTRIGGVSNVTLTSTMFNDKNAVRVQLSESVVIKAGVQYTINIKQLNGNNCFARYGQTYEPNVAVKTDDVSVSFYSVPSSSTSPSSGQIPRLYYVAM